jgi:hypothetical protein
MTILAPEVIESLVSFEEIADAARLVAADLDTGRFTLGDIANRCARVYGRDSLGQLATEIRVAKRQTLYEYAKVAARFEPSARAEFVDAGLTFSHFRTAMRAKDDAELWLSRAADDGLNVADLARAIAAAIGKPVAPRLLYSGRGVVWQYADTNRPYLVLHEDVSALAQGLSVIVKVYEAGAE